MTFLLTHPHHTGYCGPISSSLSGIVDRHERTTWRLATGGGSMPGPTIELVMYAARPGVTDAEMIAAVEATNALLQEFPGYRSREFAYSAEAGLWLDLVHWADRESALAAASTFGSHPVAQ